MLPNDFISRLKDIIPAEHLLEAVKSFSIEKPTTFRINTLKIPVKEAIAQLQNIGISLQPIAWYSSAFIIPNEQRQILQSSPLYQQGKIYIQGSSSMIPVLVLEPKPGEEVLDLTAAPGSKTCQMACLMNNQGRIAAVEKSKPRFYKLKNNVQQQGASCVQLYLKDGSQVWRYCRNRFDRVLLDAPCSSEARFKTKDPDSWKYWSIKKINDMSRKQWPLIDSAFQCLKPGGVMVYSTCSFAPEENEAIVAKLLQKYPHQIHVVPITLSLNNIQSGLDQWQDEIFSHDLKNAVRILPTAEMDGFFICKLIKIA